MRTFTAIAALAALTASAAAPAAEMSPAATQAAVRYALPHILSGVRTTCGPQL